MVAPSVAPNIPAFIAPVITSGMLYKVWLFPLKEPVKGALSEPIGTAGTPSAKKSMSAIRT